jgi:hypothetical protein
VHADIVVESRRVVERDALELLERGGEVVQLGEAAAALFFDLGLDGAEPAALQLDALGDDFLTEAIYQYASENPLKSDGAM